MTGHGVTPERYPVRVLRRNVLLLAFTAGVAVVGFGLLFTSGPLAPLLGAFGLVWGGIITPLVLLRNPFPRQKATFASANREELVVEELGVYERAKIVQAYVQPGPFEAIVRVALQDGRKLALVLSPDHAHALVRALGASATDKTATVGVRSPVSAWVAWLGGFVLAEATSLLAANFFPSSLGAVLSMAALVSWVVLIVLWAWPASATVGADGVEVRWLGRRRFYRFSEMGAPAVHRNKVSFTLTSGRVVRLVTRKKYDPEARQGADDHALAARIGEAHAAYALAGRSAAEILSRGGRSVADWLAHLKTIRSGGAAGYRSATLSEDQLVHMLADPTASAAARAGAAIALAASEDRAARVRIAAAAEACAEPRVRVALGSIAAAEGEEEWGDALARVAEEEENAAAARGR